MDTEDIDTPETNNDGNNDGFTLVGKKRRKNSSRNESDSDNEESHNHKRTDTKTVPEEITETILKDTSKPKPPPIILARAGKWFQLRLGLRDREIRYLSTVYRNGELKNGRRPKTTTEKCRNISWK